MSAMAYLNKFQEIVNNSFHLFFQECKSNPSILNVEDTSGDDYSYWDTYRINNTPYYIYFNITYDVHVDKPNDTDLIKFSVESSVDEEFREIHPLFLDIANGSFDFSFPIAYFDNDGGPTSNEIYEKIREGYNKVISFQSGHCKNNLLNFIKKLELYNFEVDDYDWISNDKIGIDPEDVIIFSGLEYTDLIPLLNFIDDEELTTKFLPQNIKDIFIF